MDTKYTKQDRGNQEAYSHYLEAMDAISIEKVASASVFFEPKAGNTIVDVGMASGTSTAILAKLFPQLQIVGVDINPTMVQISKDSYQGPNLSFLADDGELLQQFKPNSVNGFFNCSTIHHITSYNGYDNNRAFNALKRQVELLKDRGVLVVRDFLKPEEKEVFIELSMHSVMDKPSDADLFIRFSQTARSLALPEQRGFPTQELPCGKAGFRRFKAFYTDVTEFIRRKDYYDNWEVELQEEYGYYTQQEFEAVFKELGLRIILSAPIHNQWIINNRYKDKLYLYDDNGVEIGFPPTNYLIAGEKVSSSKYIQLTRHLPLLEHSFLQHSSFVHKGKQEIWDVVHRPNPVVDIIPYYRNDNSISILAKHGYPRPLVNVTSKSPVIDHKQYSGYVPEGLTVASNSDLPSLLKDRFGISMVHISTFENALQYYTSPGGIDEKVHAVYVVLKDRIPSNIPLLASTLGFKEGGYLHEYDAVQLLNTAQTGALIEARLELNLYNLFFKEHVALPAWLGEKIQVKEMDKLDVAVLENILAVITSDFETSSDSADFLTTQRALFTEMGASDSQSILEYVYPSRLSANTVLTLPVVTVQDELYVGLELRSLPVPQIHTGNSTILTVPARRLPLDISNSYELAQYVKDQKIGDAAVENYAKLGEKYFPSVGITTEQVYPFVVCLDKPTADLVWVSLKELHRNRTKIEDAHLLIAICRLMHMLNYTK